MFKRCFLWAILVGIGAPRPARGWAVLSGAPEPLNPGSIFVICPIEFFLCGNLETSLGGCAGRGGGCGVGCRGVGCWGLHWTRLVGWCGVPWGWALGVVGGGGGWWGGVGCRGGGCWELLWGSQSFPPGAVGGAVWGVVGVGAGSCYAAPWASQLGCARTPMGFTTDLDL